MNTPPQTTKTSSPGKRSPHPAVFMVLVTPFGVMSGFLTVTIGWLLAKHGLSVEQIAVLMAASYIPHVWKFLWAPIADITLNRTQWYLISAVTTALGLYAMGAIEPTVANLPLLTTVVVAANVAAALMGMTVQSLMVALCDESQQGRAGGWFQAGNLGGGGIGGGLGLWIAQHTAYDWLPGAALAVGCLLCAIPVFFLREPAADGPRRALHHELAHVGRNLWELARSKGGFLALALCFAPIGSGAASNLWSAVAGDWRASAGTVALVTGVLGGLVMAVGCVVGGWICDRMDRKTAYILFGLMQAACAAAMGFLPHSESNYVVFTLLYAFITGFTYAGFTAFVLEIMGVGAAATKFSLFASLSNFPIQWVTSIDGWAYKKHGPAGMLYVEALVGVAGMIVFMLGLMNLAKLIWREREGTPKAA